ncbi:MAG: 50S ribosomal protein L5 [Elusimicrobia bacterium]|nr:50S ribosomal protein L5 [Elusimicrobiota bacterium]
MTGKKYIPRLKEVDKKVKEEMKKKYNYKNILEAPTLEKIVVSTGHNPAKEDLKYLDEALDQIALITGQRPVRTLARKSVSNFKIRKGQPIGCKVTLRKDRMWEFLDRFINIAIPRMRDFRGLNKNAFDRDGNYSIGIRDISIFPEVNIAKISRPIGLCITLCVKNNGKRSIDEIRNYLGMIGVPFRK